LTHLVALRDGTYNPVLYILPAGDPDQYQNNIAIPHFSWSFFFEQQYGIAVLDAIYRYIVTHSRHDGNRPVSRIVLDQDAGQSLTSRANRAFAQHRIIVSGLNHQNDAGLRALLRLEQTDAHMADYRVVLSQYRGRLLRSPITDKARFDDADSLSADS